MMFRRPSAKKQQRIDAVVEMMTTMQKPETDPQGMYTGVPADPYEKPIQDADDL